MTESLAISAKLGAKLYARSIELISNIRPIILTVLEKPKQNPKNAPPPRYFAFSNIENIPVTKLSEEKGD
jgi:hypothetical protein